MTQVQSVYQSAELALAAYATLSSGLTINNKQQLVDAGMSAKQAEEFAKRFSAIVVQYTDPETSFTATIFKDSSGQLTLALRGTLEGRDYVTDGDIGLNGAGYDQIISMYNWWQRVSHSAGQSVSQYQLKSYTTVFGSADSVPPAGAVFLSSSNPQTGVTVSTYLEPAASVIATGELVAVVNTDPDRKLEVTGHSLGGHLAMAFGALFPDASGQITVFDAPGFLDTPPTNAQFFGKLKLNGSIPNGANTINIIANEASAGDAPWNAFAGLHSRPGQVVDIAVENQIPSGEPDKPKARNHSQMILTDALAVYSLLAKLDPSLNPTMFQNLLGAADNTAYQSLERTVDAIEGLLLADKVLLPTGNTQRDALYSSIYALQDSVYFQTRANGVQIVAPPTDGLAADECAQGKMNFSDQWLEDSARYLEALMEANTADTGNATFFEDGTVQPPHHCFTLGV